MTTASITGRGQSQDGSRRRRVQDPQLFHDAAEVVTSRNRTPTCPDAASGYRPFCQVGRRESGCCLRRQDVKRRERKCPVGLA